MSRVDRLRSQICKNIDEMVRTDNEITSMESNRELMGCLLGDVYVKVRKTIGNFREQNIKMV